MAFSKPKNLLRGSLRRAGIEAQVEAAAALEAFQKAADSVLGGGAGGSYRPLYLRGGTLVVRVNSAVVATELSLHREGLMEKMNAAIGRDEVRRLRFVTHEEGDSPSGDDGY